MNIFDSLGAPLGRSGFPQTNCTDSIVSLKQVGGKRDSLDFDSQWSLLYAWANYPEGWKESALHSLNYSTPPLVISFEFD